MLTRVPEPSSDLQLARSPWPARLRPAPRHLLLVIGIAVASLLAASLVVALLEQQFGVPDASAVYIVAVVVMATVFGTTPAVLTAIASFVLYDFFFTQPYLDLAVSNADEWVNLVLLLLIAVVVGRLAALQTERAAEADRRAREAQALFAISRSLATASTVGEAAPAVLARLAADSRMSRIWFSLATATGERTVVDSQPGTPRPQPRSQWTLARTAGDRPAQWTRTHLGGEPGRAAVAVEALYRVKIEADGTTLGSLWAVRPARADEPDREETRLLALAADQLGLALHRDELAAAATAAEIARESDALKSALLASVSHDLRTPLASIRAAAGSLLDPAVDWTAEGARETARAIDSEADRLNRLVRNLLDLSRIEGGALRPTFEVFDLDDLVEPVVARMRPILDGRTVDIAIPGDLPPVRVDAVHVDEALTNLLENAARYGGEAAQIRMAAAVDGEFVRLTVEDDGPGVPTASLPHLFDKFYRAASGRVDSRHGMGIGMSVVKGLVEAMGGHVAARTSALGGLAVDLDLPLAPADPASPAAGPASAPNDPASPAAGPASAPNDPASPAAGPASAPNDPASPAAGPASAPNDPASPAAGPASALADPASGPADPTAVPAHPASPAADPASPAAGPASAPNDPASPAAGPASALADPASGPAAGPASAPNDPASPAAGPASALADPASGPADPTAVPAHPASPAADPTAVPADPAAPAG